MTSPALAAALADRLPTLGDAVPVTPQRVGAGGVSFSDDLARFRGGRLAVRVRITDTDTGWSVDLRDCAEAGDGSPAFGLSPARAEVAVALAIGHALGRPGPVSRTQLHVVLDPDTWVGAGDVDDVAAVAFGMARVFDAVSGALANAWPGRVGAGSCSLGAIVELEAASTAVVEVLPGGEGAGPTGPGRDAWSGPVLATSLVEAPPPWLELALATREGSGGVGARAGGCGIVRRYGVREAATARVAIDRADNPPHGLERAGPPVGSRVRVELPGGGARAVRPWVTFDLPPRSTLVVETCGGAGHGFPGWGDIDWDG